MKVVDRLASSGIIPVVVIENASDAVLAAGALLAGGIEVAEITMRTDAALESIRNISAQLPRMLVGAGTVMDLENCKKCVDAGASFIVSPGFNREVVEWCLENDVPVFPGCATPTELTEARALGIRVVKFFPANVYGGLSALKALSGPFTDMKFIPTGGINASNLAEYVAAPFVFAVGGSWLCAKKDISDGNFEKITVLCREAVKSAMGFELAHIGINAGCEDEAKEICRLFGAAFGFDTKDGSSSCFAGNGIEVMKTPGRGTRGHIAIRCNNAERARRFLEARGIEFDEESAKYKNGGLSTLYLKDEFGGFAIHLLQK